LEEGELRVCEVTNSQVL